MDKTLGQIAHEANGCPWQWELMAPSQRETWEKIAAAVAAAVKEEDARICEAGRRAIEENRKVWEANPSMQPDETYIYEWERSIAIEEECAAAIRASIKEVK